MGDKDVAGVIRALRGRIDRWHLLDLADESRGLAADDLARELLAELPDAQVGVKGSMADIMAGLQEQLQTGDRVVVFGSFLTVAQAMATRPLD